MSKTFEFPAPRPWSIVGQAIRDREGGVVMSALNPASMETRKLIVEAVNGRAALRDLVRRFADNLRRRHILGERDNALLKEAREVLGEGAL